MDEVEIEEKLEEKPISIPFREPPIGTVDEFQKLHPKYDASIVTLHQIMRDLHLKQDLVNIKIVDGEPWDQEGYFIEGFSRSEGKTRLLVPLYLDAEIDLVWLRKLAAACEEESKTLYICIHTPESVIYTDVTTELP